MAVVERRSDPERGLDLLWRGLEPAARGPKHKLTLDQLAAAGITVADAEGLESLSIRRVAAALGVGPMSLYTYVPSKTELVELMIDRVFGEMERPDPTRDWRSQLEFLSRQRWELYHRHRWVLQANASRIPLGPNVLDATEAMYVALQELPLEADEVVTMVGVIESFLQGGSRTEVMEAQEAERTGVSYEQYWEARAGFWAKYFDAARYPQHLRLWEAGGFDTVTNGYTFGLARILDGIETMIGHRTTS